MLSWPKFGGMKTITDAVGAAGGQAALAKLLGVNPSLISQWVTGRLQVAARHCLAIESATGVTRYDLRPDVFGPSPEGQPEFDPDATRIVPVESA